MREIVFLLSVTSKAGQDIGALLHYQNIFRLGLTANHGNGGSKVTGAKGDGGIHNKKIREGRMGEAKGFYWTRLLEDIGNLLTEKKKERFLFAF